MIREDARRARPAPEARAMLAKPLMSHRAEPRRIVAIPSRSCLFFAGVILIAATPSARAQDPALGQDEIDLTGRQTLTLGSGARAYGMAGAFLARADDATAAAWNPAGLSYLRTPEISVVGNYNTFDARFGNDSDTLDGRSEEHTSELQSFRHLVCR